jgi:hypothetical protein
MTATTPSTALVTIQPAFTGAERLALAGFLAGYRVLTREAYTLDLGCGEGKPGRVRVRLLRRQGICHLQDSCR